MIRTLYQCVVRVHPPAFRREFAAEMLWIFEETAATEGVVVLFADALVSLARQWLIREGTWKVAVAAIAGMVNISLVLGGLSAVLPR